jgi:hypothetical protein
MEKIADVVKQLDSPVDREKLARLFGDMLEKENPRFDRNRFRMRACGYVGVSDSIKNHHGRSGMRTQTSRPSDGGIT